MAMGTRRDRQRQEDLWITHAELATAPGHPFYQRLNELLDQEKFDQFAERRVCALLCRQEWPPVADARNVFSVAADRLFRGD